MTIEKLKARREKLKAQLKQVDAKIAQVEKAQAEAEQRDVMRLILSKKITVSRLNELLAAHDTAGEEE